MSKTKTKKKARSVFAVLFVIVLLFVIAAAVATNVIFSGDRVPKVAGYYLYLHETADMEPDIPQNSLVFAKEAGQTSLSPGSKVLCYLADGNLALRVICNMMVDSENQTVYYPGTAVEQGTDLSIPRANIFAICIWASTDMYKFVKFATSVPGLMICLVLPCIVLIVMLLVKIARSGKEEDEFYFDEEEIEAVTRKPSKKPQAAPLFDPKQTPSADASLEKKKSSISENFSEKPVNENSPYQKAVQERTMKFKKIQQEDIERAEAEEAAKKTAAANGTQLFSKQDVENSAKQESVSRGRHFAEPEKAPRSTEPSPRPAETVRPVSEPVAEPARPKRAETERPAAKPSSTTPNIDDILNPSELRAAKSGQKVNRKIAATGSIDDLIAALENEKKKL